MLQLETELGPGGLQGKALGPFKDDHGGPCEGVFEGQSLRIVEIFNAVEVGMINLGRAGGAVDMNKRKSGASDFVFAGGTESGDDAFGERGFPAAEIPSKQHEYGGLEALREFPAPLRGFFRRVRDAFFTHAFAAPEGVGGARWARRRRLRWPAGRTGRYFLLRVRRLCRASTRRGRGCGPSRRF